MMNGVLKTTLDEASRAEFPGWFGGRQRGRHTQTDHGDGDRRAPCLIQVPLEYPFLAHHYILCCRERIYEEQHESQRSQSNVGRLGVQTVPLTCEMRSLPS